MMEKHYDADLVIAGAGYVGLSLACAVKGTLPDLQVSIIDPGDFRPPEDARASAIARAARLMLSQLGVWDDLEPHAQPILAMDVTDSKLEDVARPVFLTFEQEGDDPLAHMVPNQHLISALLELANKLDIDFIAQDKVVQFETGVSGVSVQTANGQDMRAKLLVAADGVRSSLREMAGIRTVSWNYGQKAIVCTVAHERDHGGKAIEHFLPSGPFAILPLRDNRSSLVWAERTDVAERLIDLDDMSFNIELTRRFGHALGEVKAEGRVQAFPLGMLLARDYVQNRFALAGDAAHGIHPIAGQGLNLGYKDVAALAEIIVDAERLGLDIGSLVTLERYQQWRRFDALAMATSCDAMNRLFSNDFDPLRFARNFGLGVVNRLPIAKRFFMGQAAGRSKSDPKLLQGMPL